MADSRTRDLAPRLEHAGRERAMQRRLRRAVLHGARDALARVGLAREHVQVVLDGVMDQTAKDVHVAARAARDGVHAVAVAWENAR